MKYNACCLILILLIKSFVGGQSVIRDRNESPLNVPASNVSGNGTVVSSINTYVYMSKKVFQNISGIGMRIGAADIVHLSLQGSLIDLNRIGPMEAHLQITTPGNDRLRFFGIALLGDLYLSTALDTIGITTDTTKPEYNPYTLGSIIMDIDWISMFNTIPLKSFVYLSPVDEAQLLYAYDQYSIRCALEWKLIKNSIFTETSYSIYKRKGLGVEAEKKAQAYVWQNIGFRYRIKNRISILFGIGVLVYSDFNSNALFSPPIIGVTVKIEAPILIKETNTEAIRTLIFVERNTVKKEESYSIELPKSIKENNQFKLYDEENIETDNEDKSFDYEDERKKLLKRREDVEKKMKEFEKMLQEE